MIYTFTAWQKVEVKGDIEADSEEDARRKIEEIYAATDVTGEGILFDNVGDVENLEIEPDGDIEIFDLYADESEDDDF